MQNVTDINGVPITATLTPGPHATGAYQGSLKGSNIIFKVHQGLPLENVTQYAIATSPKTHPNLAHPALTSPIGAGAVAGLGAWVGYPHIEGQAVGDAAESLTPAEGTAILIELTQAVKTLHDNGVFHHNIASHQVLIDGQKKPHLLDVGWYWNEEGIRPTTAAADVAGLKEVGAALPLTPAVSEVVGMVHPTVTSFLAALEKAKSRDDNFSPRKATGGALGGGVRPGIGVPAPGPGAPVGPAAGVGLPAPTTAATPAPASASVAAPVVSESPAVEPASAESAEPAESAAVTPEVTETEPADPQGAGVQGEESTSALAESEPVEAAEPAPAQPQEEAPAVAVESAPAPASAEPAEAAAVVEPAAPEQTPAEDTTPTHQEEAGEPAAQEEVDATPTPQAEALAPAAARTFTPLADFTPTPVNTEAPENDEPAAAPVATTAAPAGEAADVAEASTQAARETVEPAVEESASNVVESVEQRPAPTEAPVVTEAKHAAPASTPAQTVMAEPSPSAPAAAPAVEPAPAAEAPEAELPTITDANLPGPAAQEDALKAKKKRTRGAPKPPAAAKEKGPTLPRRRLFTIAGAGALALAGGAIVLRAIGADSGTAANGGLTDKLTSATGETKSGIDGYSTTALYTVPIGEEAKVFAAEAAIAIQNGTSLDLHSVSDGTKIRTIEVPDGIQSIRETRIGDDAALVWKTGAKIVAYTQSMGKDGALITLEKSTDTKLLDAGQRPMLLDGAKVFEITSGGEKEYTTIAGATPIAIDKEGLISGTTDGLVTISTADGTPVRTLELTAPTEGLSLHQWVYAGNGLAATIWTADPLATDAKTPAHLTIHRLADGAVASDVQMSLGAAQEGTWITGQASIEASYGVLIFNVARGELVSELPSGWLPVRIKGSHVIAEDAAGTRQVFSGSNPGISFNGAILAQVTYGLIVQKGNAVLCYPSSLS